MGLCSDVVKTQPMFKKNNTGYKCEIFFISLSILPRENEGTLVRYLQKCLAHRKCSETLAMLLFIATIENHMISYME